MLNFSAQRCAALVKKEFRHLIRDRGSLLLGFGIPLLLILIFGYGLSMDVRDARIAVTLNDNSWEAKDILASLDGAPDIHLAIFPDHEQARERLRTHEVDAWLIVPADFARQLDRGHATLGLITRGSDPVRAAGVNNYVEAALQVWVQKRKDRQGESFAVGVQLVDRLWFNAANNSTWYLVPGLVVLIMTLTGTFLTALVMAREWESGTLESLFVTPVRPAEILLAKMTAYFVVGLSGTALCLIAARLLFAVPIHGALPVLLVTGMIYMAVALGIGLLISAKTRNQFLASQVAILASFMPAMMLSGFIFDLRNMPLGARLAGYVLPATYFMEEIKTLFLAGIYWPLLFKNSAILLGIAALLLVLARKLTPKRLD